MTTATFYPTESASDAWESGAGAVTLTAEVKMTAGTAWGGLTFYLSSMPSNVTAVTLYYKAAAATHDSPDINWYAQAGTGSLFTTGTNNVSGRTRTTAVTQDTATDIGTSNYRSVNITSQIAELGNVSGYISLIADARTGNCDVWISSYDSAGGTAWYVVFTYTESISGTASATLGDVTGTATGALAAKGEGAATLGSITGASAATLATHGTGAATLGTVTGAASSTLATHGEGAATLGAVGGTAAGALAIKGTAGPVEGSFTLDIAAGGDDAIEDGFNGDVFLSDTGLVVSGGYECAGLLFRNVIIPPNATATSAYLNVVPFDADDPALTIRGEGSPADFTTTDYDLSDRAKTAANVAWVASNIGTGTYKPSPDISAVLNEIVGAEGWQSGDDLALFLIDNGTGGEVQFAAYDHATLAPPQLVVEWTLGAGNAVDAITGTGAATLSTHGTASSTLGAVTASGAGAFLSGGVGSVTLGAVTTAAAATLSLSGAGDVALGAVTGTAAAVIPLIASGAATLDAITTAAAGVLPIGGTASPTLGAVTSSGAAITTIVGAGAATLGDVTAAGQGELGLSPGQGASNVTLGAIAGEAAAMLLIAGAGAATLDEATAQGTAALFIAAAGSAALDAATATGARPRGSTGSVSSRVFGAPGTGARSRSALPSASALRGQKIGRAHV